MTLTSDQCELWSRCFSEACAHSEDISGAAEDQTKASMYVHCTVYSVGENHWGTCHHNGTRSISSMLKGLSNACAHSKDISGAAETKQRPQCAVSVKITEERVIVVGRGLFHQCSKFSVQCLFGGQLWLLLCAVTNNEQSLSLVCCFCVACSATHCLLSSRV